MPIYDFRCLDCQSPFEALRPLSDSNKHGVCPNCRSHNTKRTFLPVCINTNLSTNSASSNRTGSGDTESGDTGAPVLGEFNFDMTNCHVENCGHGIRVEGYRLKAQRLSFTNIKGTAIDAHKSDIEIDGLDIR